MTTISFSINGQSVSIDADGNEPILWVVREQLGLTGSKFGCGRGLCGACTMHLDGFPIRSCSTPLSFAAGKNITTIEGVGSPDALHPVQAAWLAHNVPQCGYCQSGQIMSALALLEGNNNPSDRDIDNAMSGNICRCGTYPRIKAAIKTAAADMRRGVAAISADAVQVYDPTAAQSNKQEVA